ncbi:MAG: hypothetical protein M3133_03560, partial [Actinomycetota bacterium]|nr:hypothetical protein [Actinomycetota bacterium]
RELHRADIATIDRHRVGSGQIGAPPEIGVMRLTEYTGIELGTPPTSPTEVLVRAPSEAARVVIPGVTGGQTVRELVTAAVASDGPVSPEYQALNDTLESLEWLAGRSAAELDRALLGLLDVYSHRLDAWYTSLATRRLVTVRGAAPSGIHVGGYGWLDDLRPAATAGNQGFIHTPSLAQASTAAVLRSGYLAHGDPEDPDHKVLDLDLSSARVRTALALLEGVGQGQPLSALLGYRFERALRERRPTLARFILPLRQLVPLRPDGSPPVPPSASPSEALAARDVVDGVALVDRWRNEGFDFLLAVGPGETVPTLSPVGEEIERLADVYDAVADLLVAEAVHQNVQGNNERAGAALAALDRQGIPPPTDFVRTPRTGKSFTHRVLVLIADESLPASWQAAARDPRAAAEPRLNAWVARLIGDPRRVRFAATTGLGEELMVGLDELGLSPLSVVMAARTPGSTAPSELEERVVHRLAAQLPGDTATTELVLLDTAPSGSDPSTVGLGALRALARRTYELITTQRPATAADLALPHDEADEGFDGVELGSRADGVVTAYGSTVSKLDRAQSAPSIDAVYEALWDAAGLGVPGSVPALDASRGADPSFADGLVAQAAAVAATMRATAAQERALAAQGAGASSRAQVRHHTERVRALLGEQFPVLPRFSVANADALTASHGARATLCAGDDLAPTTW